MPCHRRRHDGPECSLVAAVIYLSKILRTYPVSAPSSRLKNVAQKRKNRHLSPARVKDLWFPDHHRPRLQRMRLLPEHAVKLVVFSAGDVERCPLAGVLLASASLACMTFGAILQKRLKQQPVDVLPLQNVVGLTLSMLFVPFEPVAFVPSADFLVALL